MLFFPTKPQCHLKPQETRFSKWKGHCWLTRPLLSWSWSELHDHTSLKFYSSPPRKVPLPIGKVPLPIISIIICVFFPRLRSLNFLLLWTWMILRFLRRHRRCGTEKIFTSEKSCGVFVTEKYGINEHSWKIHLVDCMSQEKKWGDFLALVVDPGRVHFTSWNVVTLLARYSAILHCGALAASPNYHMNSFINCWWFGRGKCSRGTWQNSWKQKITPPRTSMTGWNIHHEWRRISYWKWAFSNVMLGLRFRYPSNSPLPIVSMYAIFSYIYHKNQPNVGKYTIRRSYGLCMMAARFIDSTPAVCAVAGAHRCLDGTWKTTPIVVFQGILFGGNCVTPIFFIGWQDWPASSSHLCSQKMIHFEDVHITPGKINVERSPQNGALFRVWSISGSLAVRFHDFHEYHTPEV